jgi:hypothetical protein
LNAYGDVSITNAGLPKPIGRDEGRRMLIAMAGKMRALVAAIVGQDFCDGKSLLRLLILISTKLGYII